MKMHNLNIVSYIILIAIISQSYTVAVDYFKYESTARQSRVDNDSHRTPLAIHEKRSANVYNIKCPKQEYIHPCDCLELDKRVESELESSGDGESDTGTTGTPTLDLTIDDNIHPDLIETVAFCKNIRNVQVLTDAIKGFQGHRINYFVLDGCKLPPFPNSLFNDVNILWMEILNSTLQFHENYFNTNHCP
ncbi:uncharacterized protein LOC128957374 [Oppia nitens]|uniref:uncharacterized protein LOC128957374 n=1 Tax=Oppia nitens TaxID=1686743 RepID=UPI0023DB606C|nr:uncharacterized protein LOC128957374 [Oppia nitens]